MRTLLLFVIASLQTACLAEDTGPLTFDAHNKSRVSGTYLHRDVLIGFEISQGATVHSTTFTSEDGAPLIDLQVERAHQKLTVLGGQLVVDGSLGSTDPIVHGDVLAMRSLEARRELFAIEELYVDLEAAGVEMALLSPPPPPPAPARVLAHGETTYWWSTFGAGPRTYELVNSTPGCTAIEIGSFPTGREVVLATGTQEITRYGWSGLIEIQNLGEWTGWNEPVCNRSAVTVRVLP